MIIDLPGTTSNAVSKRLVKLRDEGGAVALGRVLTLVIETSEADLEGAIEAANGASREHPCRVIVLSLQQGDEPRLDAQIRIGGDAGASEVVVLRTWGELSNHLDTLVIPLLLPDAPIVVWWPGEVPASPAEHPIGRIGHRRITDSTSCEDPLAALHALRDAYQEGDTDLAWTKVTVWRGLLAATLDQPPFERVKRVEVEGESTHSSVDILAAWLAQQLRVPVEIIRRNDVEGVSAVRLHRASGVIELDRPDGRMATLRQPGKPEHRIAMPLRQLDECLSEELRRLDADDVYGQVLTRGLARVAS